MLTTRSFHSLAGLYLACAAIHAQAAPGDLDSDFATGGKFQTPVGGTGGASVGGLIVQSDGGIFIGGDAWNDATSNYDFALVRLTEGGVLDTSYDTDGKALFPIGPKNDSGYAMARSPLDDSFVIAGAAGSTNFTTSEFAVARFDSEGNLDTAFDTDGKATVSVLDNARNDANAVVIQSDGKVLVAGSSYIGGSPRIGLARFNSNGALDTGFDLDGKLLINPGNESQCTSVKVRESDGSIVVAGYFYNGNNGDFLIARYDSTGNPDNTFGGDGIVTTAVGGWDRAQDLVIQADGRIIAVGISSNGTNDDFTLVRYNTDGTLDTTFGGDGIVTTDFGSYDSAYSVLIDAEGRIVVTGSANNNDGNSDFAVARYLDDGTLDASFGSGGKVMTPIGNSYDDADAMAIQDDGGILVAGETSTTLTEFAVLRYLGDPEVVEPTRKADVRLGTGGPLTTGSNVYNLTGKNQTESIKITSGKSRTVEIGIQNDGTAADGFKVKGTAGNKDFSVVYQLGSRDVTDAVTAGKFKTGALDPGEMVTLKAKIKAKTAKAGKEKVFSILATSNAKATIQDKALIKATSRAAN